MGLFVGLSVKIIKRHVHEAPAALWSVLLSEYVFFLYGGGNSHTFL